MLRERACVCAHWLRTFFLQKYTDSVAACFSVSVCGFVSVHLALYIYYRCAQHVFILLTFVSGFLPREIYSIIWGGKSYQVRLEREKGRRICCISLSLMINLHSFVSENVYMFKGTCHGKVIFLALLKQNSVLWSIM